MTRENEDPNRNPDEQAMIDLKQSTEVQIPTKASDQAQSKTTATLLVNELFASIQGESTYAGRPCTFIRLTGCPLRCRWCDSEFAYSDGERLPQEEILQRVASLGHRLVEVTGGEPLAQPGCPDLLKALCDASYEVLLETNGAMDMDPVDRRVVKIVDVKCPSSGESDKTRWDQLTQLGDRDELKFVIAGRDDYLWARQALIDNDMQNVRPIHFSPVQGELSPAKLAQWIIEDKLPVRLHLQLHKIIWPGVNSGV